MIVTACAARTRSILAASGVIDNISFEWFPSSRDYQRATVPTQRGKLRNHIHSVLEIFLSDSSWDLAPLDSPEKRVDYLAIVACWLQISPGSRNSQYYRTTPVTVSEASLVARLVKVLLALDQDNHIVDLVPGDLLVRLKQEIMQGINSEFEDLASDVDSYKSRITDDVKLDCEHPVNISFP